MAIVSLDLTTLGDDDLEVLVATRIGEGWRDTVPDLARWARDEIDLRLAYRIFRAGVRSSVSLREFRDAFTPTDLSMARGLAAVFASGCSLGRALFDPHREGANGPARDEVAEDLDRASCDVGTDVLESADQFVGATMPIAQTTAPAAASPFMPARMAEIVMARASAMVIASRWMSSRARNPLSNREMAMTPPE